MKLLLHTCCAPCLIGTLPFVKDFDTSCYWFNPNIHPYMEYKSRLNALENFAHDNNINLIIKDDYGLRKFTRNVINNLENRCGFCYDCRIKACAEFASANHFNAFTSTLLVSPYQNHGKIKEICEKYADLYNITFFYGDFRDNFRAGQKKAREYNLYMQKYCGCIFSEEERYLKK